MPQPNDLSKSLLALDQDSTLVAVIEMGRANWLVAGIVPGVKRHPLKKIATDQEQLLQVLRRWAKEAETAGRMIKRIAIAYEAGRDGFWLARWLRARGIEAYVIHPSSVPVSREYRRAKTDRLDTELLKRAFLGWLRGEPDHCSMAARRSPRSRRRTQSGPAASGEISSASAHASSTGSRGHWRALASATSSRRCVTRHSFFKPCTPRKTSLCRPTPWPSWARHGSPQLCQTAD
jgi:hypothetical protein